MSDKVAELSRVLASDGKSASISHLWDKFNGQRRGKIEEWKELRNYLFATDTSSTSNSSLPWKNSTTTPKLTQIRDNLHSNYLSSLFPNDDYLRWMGYSKEDSVLEKAKAIQSYMGNKCKENSFRTTVSKLVYDYIDYGNAFATVGFESRYKELLDGSIAPSYIGPTVERISPLDIVFNPTASSFKHTFKIIRSIKTLGELRKVAKTEPENSFWAEALERRDMIKTKYSGYRMEDFDKAAGYSVDGFGNLHEYYSSDYVEVLEFFGDWHDAETGELYENRLITIVDRSVCVRDVEIPSWFGHTPIYHVGWRFRSDNLWAMGPLDNLVGMQYRIDHLENLKADAMDLVVHPPLAIAGDVEEFVWAPGARIYFDEGGGVTPLTSDLSNLILANNEIAMLEDKMEMFAGAPREAMGVRTPGEKTAFEVQELSNAASRIFQEKITTFEVELLEPVLNAMLETAVRNMEGTDVIRVMDTALGIETFRTITVDDITANGVLRPIGARHFAKQAQDLQNLMGVFNSGMMNIVSAHISPKNLTRYLEDVLGVESYEIFKYNAAIVEGKETQQLAMQAEEDLLTEASSPTAE